MIDLKLTISIITLNINGLNIPLRNKISSGCMKKQDPTICIATKNPHFKYKGTSR